MLAAAGAAIEPGAANALLAAAAAAGACDTAMHVFNTMHAAQVWLPDKIWCLLSVSHPALRGCCSPAASVHSSFLVFRSCDTGFRLTHTVDPQVEVDAGTAAALLRALQAGAHADAARAVIDVLASPLGGCPPRPGMWPVLVAACEAARDWHRALELALVSRLLKAQHTKTTCLLSSPTTSVTRVLWMNWQNMLKLATALQLDSARSHATDAAILQSDDAPVLCSAWRSAAWRPTPTR